MNGNNSRIAIYAILIQAEGRDGAHPASDPAFIYIRTNGIYHARSLPAVLGRQLRRLKILPGSEHHFRAVQADRLHLESNLSLARLWQRQFVDLDHFRSTQFVEANDSCGCACHESLLTAACSALDSGSCADGSRVCMLPRRRVV